MRKIIKSLIALSVIAVFTVFTVLCCCTGTALMAHFHKSAMCSHCQGASSSQDHSSNTAGTCQHQFQSAEFAPTQAISSSIVSTVSFPGHVFLDKHITTLPPSSSLAYPPGSPPLTASLTPLYLRTFSLRI